MPLKRWHTTKIVHGATTQKIIDIHIAMKISNLTYTCTVISYATVYIHTHARTRTHTQCMNKMDIKANETCKQSKNVFGKHAQDLTKGNPCIVRVILLGMCNPHSDLGSARYGLVYATGRQSRY
jgi:hypothetical protein